MTTLYVKWADWVNAAGLETRVGTTSESEALLFTPSNMNCANFDLLGSFLGTL